MSSATEDAGGDEAPDLRCQLDCVQGMVDALSSVRWKRHQVPKPYPRPLPLLFLSSTSKVSSHLSSTIRTRMQSWSSPSTALSSLSRRLDASRPRST